MSASDRSNLSEQVSPKAFSRKETAQDNIAKLTKSLEAQPVASRDLYTGSMSRQTDIVDNDVVETQVQDKLGDTLTLRTENGSPVTMQETMARNERAPYQQVRFDIYRGDQCIGYARLGLQVNKEGNFITDRYDKAQNVQARLEYIGIDDPTQRGRGIGKILLDRVETHARMSGAKEIVGFPESDSARSFFEHNGYQTPDENPNSPEIRKKL
ncbi:MAG TPA: GNAT family N-acetyltransferase [Anaerolineae bacterium]|nr:GNAT family N-acetyltransferase [Anaerolineae bacterium]HQH36927.1 GNAT family N-acetyltransferase [Anaerolineae bacterium]